MQGSKDNQQVLFQYVTIGELVPSDHFVRKLARFIDLKWVRPTTEKYYSGMGRPSVDPVVIAKMLLICFFEGIRSERELMRQIQVNVAYRWYLGYRLDESIPSHSVLSKCRRRFGQVFFERLFQEVLKQCRQAGLVDGDTILVDSTMIHANASMDSIKSYWGHLEESVEEPASPALGFKKSRTDKLSNHRRSTTDPDATFIHKPGQKGLGYKASMAADAANGVITAVTVSTACIDDTAAIPELLADNGQASTIVADGTYGSHDCLEYLQTRGLETVIKHRGGGNRHGELAKSDFVYDSNRDCFICPQLAVLNRTRTDRKKRKAVYSCSKEACDGCPWRPKCIGDKPAGKVRQITRYDTPYIDRATQAVASEDGRRLLRLRQTCIEGLFGQAKQWHGLGRARWRRLKYVRMQVLITAAILNIKKLIKGLFDKRPKRIIGSASHAGQCYWSVIIVIALILFGPRLQVANQ